MRFRTRWLEEWTRERTTKTGEDPGTGAPTVSTTTETVQLQVSFNRSGLRVSEFLNYRMTQPASPLRSPARCNRTTLSRAPPRAGTGCSRSNPRTTVRGNAWTSKQPRAGPREGVVR